MLFYWVYSCELIIYMRVCGECFAYTTIIVPIYKYAASKSNSNSPIALMVWWRLWCSQHKNKLQQLRFIHAALSTYIHPSRQILIYSRAPLQKVYYYLSLYLFVSPSFAVRNYKRNCSKMTKPLLCTCTLYLHIRSFYGRAL